MGDVRLQRWDRPILPTERDLNEICFQAGLFPYEWSNAPGEFYPTHSHAYDKVIVVVRGSITWVLPQTNERLKTRTGDRLELPRGVRHAAEVGPEGVTCLEGHEE